MATAEVLIEELWERIGEPSDLDPYDGAGAIDATSSGWTKMLRALNRGQTQVATWRDPQSGRQFRWKSFYAWQDVTQTPVDDTLDAAIVADTNTVEFTASGTADLFNNYAVIVGTEVRTIIDDDGAGVYTVHRTWDRAHDIGDAVTYVPRFVSLDAANTKFVDVLQVQDFEDDRVLEPAERGDNFASWFASDGPPRRWYRLGSRVYFDTVDFDDPRTYRVEYYRLPTDMTLTTSRPELPEQFDEAILLWAVGWGFARMLDPANRSSARSEFVAEMRQRQGEQHIADERNPYRGGYVVMR